MELGVKPKRIKEKIRVKIEDDTIEIRELKHHIDENAILSDEEVLWLFRKKHKRRTDKDIQNLINSNLALVYSLSVQYLNRHNNINPTLNIPFMDVFNNGVLGLYRAIELFDSIKQMKFSTYAYFWVAKFIRIEIRRQIYPLKTYSYNHITIVPQDEVKEIEVNPDQHKNLSLNILINKIKKVLTPQQQPIFEEFFINEVSVVDISKSMSITKSIIYHRIKDIQKKIKEELPELKLDLQNK